MPAFVAARRALLSRANWPYPKHLTVDGKPMVAYLPVRPYAFATPAADVYDFEIRPGDLGRYTESFDEIGRKHRSELSQTQQDAFAFGTPVWFATRHRIRGSVAGFVPKGQNVVFQFHGVDDHRSPPFGINITNDRFQVQSQSDDGGFRLLYAGVLPKADEDEEIVGKITFARVGRCEVWRQGDKIVDYAGPIGWFSDIEKGLQAAYAQFGNYCDDIHPFMRANRHTAPRWGLQSLLDRVVQPEDYGPDLAPPPSNWLDASEASSRLVAGSIGISFFVVDGRPARAFGAMATDVGAAYRVRRADDARVELMVGTSAGADDVVGATSRLEFAFVARTAVTWIAAACAADGAALSACSCREILTLSF